MIESTNRFARLHRLVPRIAGPDEPVSRPLVPGHLSIALAIDGAAGRRDVTQDDLDRWEASFDELLPLAVDNLRRATRDDGWIPVKGHAGLRIYDAKTGAAAARMLILDELVQPAPVAGMVVAVPGPDQLVAVTLDSLEAVESLRVLVNASDAAVAGGDPLSNQLFWFDGQDWHHLPVQHLGDEIRILPNGSFMAAVERLAAMDYFMPAAAEA